MARSSLGAAALGYPSELQGYRLVRNSECHVVGEGHLRPALNVRCEETVLSEPPGPGKRPIPAPSTGSRCAWPEAFQPDPLEECRSRCDADKRCRCFTFANNGAFTRCVGSDQPAAAVSHARGRLERTAAYIKLPVDAASQGGSQHKVGGPLPASRSSFSSGAAVATAMMPERFAACSATLRAGAAKLKHLPGVRSWNVALHVRLAGMVFL
uniref:Uncharacterized protein n=1 Tax=Pyrodinium bahamense TaxID=73915 RepID=A0A7S0AKX1_9DINO|mmetsp:Transcript_36842/g.102238  ORF Transcript_36842/g.102238 Transcript_36842/m.102238 type:complete len:211 (+) Transcript_36842:32-664(+)